MSDLRSPALYHIHTRVWGTVLSHKLGRLATLEDMSDANEARPNGYTTHARPPGLAASHAPRPEHQHDAVNRCLGSHRYCRETIARIGNVTGLLPPAMRTLYPPLPHRTLPGL